MLLLVYAAIPAAVGILILFSRKIQVPEAIGATGITKLFCRAACLMYERLPAGRLQAHVAPLERSLRLLNPRSRGQHAGRDYFIKKTADVLMLLCAGSILGAALYITAHRTHLIDEEGRIARADYEAHALDTVLTAQTDEGEALGAYDVHVSSRRYTKEQSDALFEEAAKELPGIVAAQNASLNDVTSDLSLVGAVPGFPFSLTWKSSNYARVHSDGRVDFEEIPEEGEVVTLTAFYTYEDWDYEQVLYAHVKKPVPDADALQREQMAQLLLNADAQTLEETHYTLPKTYGTTGLTWTETVKDSSPFVFLLLLAAAVAVFVARDKEIERSMEERRRQLLTDYPQFVSQLVLFLGAGMSVRGIVKKIASAYAKERAQGAEVRFLSEELLRVTFLLDSGTAEGTAYEQLGLRCGMQQYTRLCTLLTQNLRKGSNDLLRVLEEESAKAFSERLDLARKRGEEAGTKLLLPMMILLGIVMVIIMIPAYAAF